MSAATMTRPSAPATAAPPSPFAGKASSGGGGSYDLCPAGNHPAHLVAIYDLGTHDEEYQGKPRPDVRKLFLAWELSGEFKPNGDPFVIGRDFSVGVDPDGSFAFNEKSNLRLMLESWMGKKYAPGDPIDPMKALGRPCLLNVTHSDKGDKTYHNIGNVTALPRGMTAPTRNHETVAYHVSMGEPPVLIWLPYAYHRTSGKVEPLEAILKASKEFTGKPIGKGGGKPADTPYSEAAGASSPAPVDDDDIPF